MEGLHPEATIKSWDYHIVVHFIPLLFKPEKEANIHEMEEVNGMETGDIIRARWIKPISRRLLTQTCGHAIFTFPSPQAANPVLANSIFVYQKKVYAKKCKKEPMRCLKCHRPHGMHTSIGHLWYMHTMAQN